MRTLLTTLLYLLLLSFQSATYGQTLADFKTASENASNKKGLDAIPYENLRKDAGSIQNDINSWKQRTASFKSAGEYETAKSNIYKNIKNENEILKKREDYIKDLKSRNVDASQFEKELEENHTKIKQYNEEIIKLNDEIADAVEAWDRLERLRGGLRETTDDVLDRLSGSKSSPDSHLGSEATEDDKKKLEQYIDIIDNYVREEAKGHSTAETEAGKAMENMDKALKKSSE